MEALLKVHPFKTTDGSLSSSSRRILGISLGIGFVDFPEKPLPVFIFFLFVAEILLFSDHAVYDILVRGRVWNRGPFLWEHKEWHCQQI